MNTSSLQVSYMDKLSLAERRMAEARIREIAKVIHASGNRKSLEELVAIGHRWFEGSAFLNSAYHDWQMVFRLDEIDVRNPAQSPYNVVIARFELVMTPLLQMRIERAVAMAFIPAMLDDNDESLAINYFWNNDVRAFHEIRAGRVLTTAIAV